MLLIGMVTPGFLPSDARKRAIEVQEIRRDLQQKYQKDYEQVNQPKKIRNQTVFQIYRQLNVKRNCVEKTKVVK